MDMTRTEFERWQKDGSMPIDATVAKNATTDLVSRQRLLSILNDKAFDRAGHDAEYRTLRWVSGVVENLPSASEIIHCKDCKKHNIGVTDTWEGKKNACPLISWRGKAQGHECDYQFCAFAERKMEVQNET